MPRPDTTLEQILEQIEALAVDSPYAIKETALELARSNWNAARYVLAHTDPLASAAKTLQTAAYHAGFAFATRIVRPDAWGQGYSEGFEEATKRLTRELT